MSAPENLSCYVPRHVRRLCQKGVPGEPNGSLPEAASAAGFPFYVVDHDAAIAIVDISGFSKLTSQLSSTFGDSGAGADKLRAIINVYFDRLIQITHASGGDIFKFSGDSMICCWSEDRELRTASANHTLKVHPTAGPSEAYRKGLKCCIDMLKLFEQSELTFLMPSATVTPPSVHTSRSRHRLSIPGIEYLSGAVATSGAAAITSHPKLSIHVGFATGTVNKIHVGVPGVRRECFLTGVAVRDASQSLDFAAKGELAMSKSTWSSLSALLSTLTKDLPVPRESGGVLVLDSEALRSLSFGPSANTSPQRAPTRAPPGIASDRRRRSSFVGLVPTALPLSGGEVKQEAPGLKITPSAQSINKARRTSLVRERTVDRSAAYLSATKNDENTRATSIIEDMVCESNLSPHYTEYINEATVHRLRTSSSETQQLPINMIRKLTSVFIRFLEFPLEDGKQGMERSQLAMETIVPPLRQFEGTMRQFNVDDKGATLLLVWGLPPFGHELESSFALQATIAIRDALREHFNGQFAIGVTTDMLFTGSIGNELRSDHSILGQGVNQAARLMCKDEAASDILCCEKTHSETRRVVKYRDTAFKFLLKGTPTPVEAFLPEKVRRWVQGERGRRSQYAPGGNDGTKAIVGRGAEQEMIKQMLVEWEKTSKTENNDSNAGGSLQLIVKGDSGEGKSTLGQFFIAEAKKVPNSIVCCGRASEMEKSTPFFTIRELMRSFFQQVDKSPQITTSKSRRNASNGSGYKSLADLRPAIGGSEETGLPKEIPIFSVQAPSRRSIFEVQDVENGTEIGEQRPEPTDIPWWAEAIGISPDGDSERETGSPTSSATSKSDTNERDAVSDTSSRSSSNRVQSPKDDGSPIALAPDGSKDKIENLIPRRVTLPVLGGRSRAKSADAGKPKNLAVPEKEIHLQTLSSRKRKEDSSAPKILASLSKSRSKISLGRHPSVGDSQCSADDISDHDPAKLAQSMKRAVLKLKGSWHLLPTLNELMGVCFPQNRMTVHLDSDSARRTAVSALVKWINTASSDMKIPIALCVDDAHWQDTQSWEVLAELLRNCPKVCVFIGSRHIKEYDASMAPYFQSILDSPLVRTATLTSLDENSLGELVVSVFQFRGVQRADPRLLSEILRRTAGNCFVAETVCESMLSYFEEEGELNDPGGRSLMVDDKGTLIHTQVGTSPSSRLAASPSTASPQSPLAQFVERFLPRGAFSAIVTQYDRLGSRFQRILAVASCICQTTIRSLWAVCMRDEELSLLVGGSASPQMLSVFLRAEDKYNFLAFGRPPASPDDVVIGQRNTLAFRHSIIQKAIYSTLLSEEKDRFHSTMVDHLTEDLLDDTNTGQIMPLIIYHLEQLSSGENFRKVDSYITILTYYHEAGFVAEGLSTYAKLNSLLEKTGIQPPPASLFRRSRGYSLMRRETQNEENLGQLIVAQLRRRSSNQVRYLYQQKRTTIEKNVADFYVALHEFEEVTNHIRNSLQYFNKPFPNGATWLRPFLRFRDRVWHMYTFLRLKRSASEGVPLRDIRAQYLIKGMEETAIIWWLDSLCLLESSMSVTSDCSELMHLRLLIFNVSACIASSQPLKFAVGLAVVSTSLAQMGKLIQSEEYLRLAFKIGNINVVQGAKSDITEKPRTEMTRQSLTTRNDGSLLKTVASLRRRISNGSAVSDGENMSEKTRSRNIPLKVNTRQSQLFGRRLSPPFRSGDLGSPQRGSQKWHHGSGFLADPQTPGTAVNSSPVSTSSSLSPAQEHVLRIATWRSTCLGKWKEAVHYGNLVLSSYEMHSGEGQWWWTQCFVNATCAYVITGPVRSHHHLLSKYFETDNTTLLSSSTEKGIARHHLYAAGHILWVATDEDEKTVCLEAHRRLASLMTSLPQECKRCETFLRVAALRYTLSSDSDSEKLITSSNLLVRSLVSNCDQHCLELDMFAWWTTLTMAVRTLRNWADRLLLRTLSRPMEHENISIEKERWFDVQQLVLRQVNAISYRSHQLELTSMCRVLSRALGSDEALLRRSEHDGKEHHLKHVGQKIQATIDRETPFLENSPMMEAVIMSQLYRTMILESLEGPASTISWTDVRLKDRVVECNTRVHNLLRYQGLSYELRLHQDWAGLLQNA